MFAFASDRIPRGTLHPFFFELGRTPAPLPAESTRHRVFVRHLTTFADVSNIAQFDKQIVSVRSHSIGFDLINKTVSSLFTYFCFASRPVPRLPFSLLSSLFLSFAFVLHSDTLPPNHVLLPFSTCFRSSVLILVRLYPSHSNRYYGWLRLIASPSHSSSSSSLYFAFCLAGASVTPRFVVLQTCLPFDLSAFVLISSSISLTVFDFSTFFLRHSRHFECHTIHYA